MRKSWTGLIQESGLSALRWQLNKETKWSISSKHQCWAGSSLVSLKACRKRQSADLCALWPESPSDHTGEGVSRRLPLGAFTNPFPIGAIKVLINHRASTRSVHSQQRSAFGSKTGRCGNSGFIDLSPQNNPKKNPAPGKTTNRRRGLSVGRGGGEKSIAPMLFREKRPVLSNGAFVVGVRGIVIGFVKRIVRVHHDIARGVTGSEVGDCGLMRGQ